MSKELEMLEALRSHNYHKYSKKECLDTIEIALKQHKALMEAHPLNIRNNMALDIIREKCEFNFILDSNFKSPTYVVEIISPPQSIVIFINNESEFELLKEVLSE